MLQLLYMSIKIIIQRLGGIILIEFKKWGAVRAGVCSMLASVAWMASLHVWHACVGRVLTWVSWVVC